MKDHTDGLNELFRKKLADNSPADNGWNIPSDNILFSALENVQPVKPKNKEGYRKYLFLLLLFIPFGIALISYNEIQKTDAKIDQLSDDIQEIKANIQQNQDDNSIIEYNPINSGIKNLKQEKISLISDTQPKGNNSVKLLSTELYNSVNHVLKSNVTRNHSSSEKVISVNQINSSSNKEKLNTTSLENSKARYITSLDLLKRNSIQALASNEYLIDPRFDLSNELVTKTGSSWHLGISGIHNIATISMADIKLKDDSFLKKYDRFYSSTGIAASIAYQGKNGFGVELGLDYQNFKNQSHYQQQLTYDKSLENLDSDGNLSYPFSMEVMSPMGAFSKGAEMSVKETVINDQDIITNDWYMNQSFNSIGISLGITKNFNLSNKFSVGIGIGGQHHLIRSANQNSNTTMFLDDEKIMDFDDTRSVDLMNERFTTSYLKAGVSYKLSDKINLDISSAYHYGLNSFTSNANPDHGSSFIRYYKNQIGLSYKF